jgi:hypothetical protein
MSTRDFLKGYQNILLRHMILPGSHDAGLADESYQGLGLFGSGKARTVTQSVGVGEQAVRGSRFFDVRIISSGGQLKAYHSPKDTRAVGGVGQSFETILDELQGFVRSNPSEFVIIRLAHIKDSAAVFESLLAWMDKPAVYGKKNGDFVYKGTGNLANKFVSELAGRIVLVVEGSKLKPAKFPGRVAVPGQTDGFHTLYQNKKGKPLPDVTNGLCMCGEFASSTDLSKIVAKQTSNYSLHDQHRTHADNKVHLYCLYWTSTGGNIEQNTRQMATNFKLVRGMVAKHTSGTVQHCLDHGIPLVNTKAWSGAIGTEDRARGKYAVYSVSLPNIILYDFVNSDTSAEIIGLNGLTLVDS